MLPLPYHKKSILSICGALKRIYSRLTPSYRGRSENLCFLFVLFHCLFVCCLKLISKVSQMDVRAHARSVSQAHSPVKDTHLGHALVLRRWLKICVNQTKRRSPVGPLLVWSYTLICISSEVIARRQSLWTCRCCYEGQKFPCRSPRGRAPAPWTASRGSLLWPLRLSINPLSDCGGQLTRHELLPVEGAVTSATARNQSRGFTASSAIITRWTWYNEKWVEGPKL